MISEENYKLCDTCQQTVSNMHNIQYNTQHLRCNYELKISVGSKLENKCLLVIGQWDFRAVNSSQSEVFEFLSNSETRIILILACFQFKSLICSCNEVVVEGAFNLVGASSVIVKHQSSRGFVSSSSDCVRVSCPQSAGRLPVVCTVRCTTSPLPALQQHPELSRVTLSAALQHPAVPSPTLFYSLHSV